jgi:hypothetical protein
VPRNGVNNAFSLRFNDPAAIAAIVFECWPQVETFYSMWGPRAALMWLFVKDDAHAKWHNGMCVKI